MAQDRGDFIAKVCVLSAIVIALILAGFITMLEFDPQRQARAREKLQADEARDIDASMPALHYAMDRRTDVCFVVWGDGRYLFSTVPCTPKVLALIGQ